LPREANRLAEISIAIRHHAHHTGGLELTTPCAHHKGVIDRDAPDFIYALGLEFFGVLHIARHVLRRAGRCVSAGQAEDGNGLALDEIGHIECVRSERAAFGFRFDELGEFAFREVVSGFDGHGIVLWVEKSEGTKKKNCGTAAILP